ncbi:hypothetical protein C8A03DRAFT_14158 [Achaetomium macrosporum]|uniref:Uncharacterized protein n=1 Tax=Achaetomium macrosporum TaxID=79813 RepID=A0AAN7CCV5_9PEZI|nr:hypothetical protein C8A03DRAFT_14158 [Achaetomium macrosporum]
MERDKTQTAGPRPVSRGAEPNTRFISPLTITSASRRRSLFSRHRPEEGAARPTSSGSVSDTNAASSNNTRIPGPAQRRPFTLSDAYRMAEEEEAAQGSPSPAPRLWRSRRESTSRKLTKNRNSGSIDSQHRAGLNGKHTGTIRDDGPADSGVPSQQSDLSDSTFDEKLRQYALDQPDSEGPELLRRSTHSLAEAETALPEPQTPNKSFAWEADADFTAGDLQVSDSPPVAIKRSNTKIDEIRSLEAEVNDRFTGSPQHRPRNTLIGSLRALESEVALKVPDVPLESDDDFGKGTRQVAAEAENTVPRPRSVSRASAIVDELRSREIESLSRRALAAARLDEFRERNTGTSRSPSPDIARRSSREPMRASSSLGDRLRRQDSDGLANAVRAQEGSARQVHSSGDAADPGIGQETSKGQETHGSSSQSKDEPRDVLRQLAARMSVSPAPEVQTIADSEAPPATRNRDVAEGGTQKGLDGGAKRDARTVAFVGLQRRSSIESRLSKRRSFVNSEADPTERIEGEMKLFAPLENQSEKGSLRAPSPEPDEEAPDETPKPAKLDPLTQPTPRVIGAFVETPATVKVEKPGEPATRTASEDKGAEHQATSLGCMMADESADSKPPVPPLFREGKDGTERRHHKRTQSAGSDRVSGRSSSLSTRRRARSFSRGRRPLINSARPPTVKDDLLEIRRANHIDDSTLDDIAELFGHQGLLDATLGSGVAKPENSDNDAGHRENELEAYDRLNRSLQTGLLGIRTAKHGIEQLETKVSQADIKEHSPHAVHGDGTGRASPSGPSCRGSKAENDAAVTYIHLPLPRLWYRWPTFRFTFLGLGLFLLSLWYIAESLMCFRYCKPEYCYPGISCDWSSDDPLWGYAIPVKLDQWVTGGQGREFARRLRPEVADWLADMWDAATGTDISTVDTSRYSWEQKRQHRRRLAKKGLGKPLVERPEDQAVFNVWRSVREAKEKAQAAHEMGYELDEDESIAGDEKL